jgi:dynein heavy chain
MLYPEEKSVYDYEFSLEEKIYVPWDERNAKFAVDGKLGYHEAMIPTPDSTRNIFLLKLLMTNSKHVMCPGPTGTGKTLNIFTLLT